jgi:hypothetical protein
MRNMSDPKVVRISDGDIALWEEQGTSVHIRAITPQGDPVELSAEEARELARELLRLAALIE